RISSTPSASSGRAEALSRDRQWPPSPAAVIMTARKTLGKEATAVRRAHAAAGSAICGAWLWLPVVLCLLGAAWLARAPATGKDETLSSGQQLQTGVLALFQQKCVRCHGGKARKAELDL